MKMNWTEWIFLLFALTAIALMVYSRRNPQQIAPMSQVMNRVIGGRVGRIALVTIWWWIGWHFFVSKL